MRFVTIPLRNLSRRPLRSALTVLGLTTAVGSLLAMVGLSEGLQEGWTRMLLARGTHVVALRKGTANVLTGGVRADMARNLCKVEGVRCVFTELLDMVPVEGGQSVLVAGWEGGSPLWNSVRMQDGHAPKPGAGEVMLGQAVADLAGKRVGDKLKLGQQSLTVSGVFVQDGAIGNGMAVLPLDDLQAIMGMSGSVTGFNLQVDRPDDPERIAGIVKQLRQDFPDLSFYPTKEAAEQNDMLKLLRAAGWGISVLAIAMAAVIVMNSLLMSVTERTHEIGVLSAIGWSSSRMLGMIVLEGLLLTVAGNVLGTLAGLGALGWLVNHPKLRGFLEMHVSVGMLLEVWAAALLLGLAASIYPAWRAVRLNTIEAIRHE